MSIADDARACVILADFANSDPSGKANFLGAGWQVTAVSPAGTTSPLSLAALIEVPQRWIGDEFAVSLTLRDESGEMVKMPGPSGELQAVRIQQILKVERPNVPGVMSMGKLWSRSQIILNFPMGLPLARGQSYTWQLEIDGQDNPQWCASFLVAGVPPPPVAG